MKTKDLKKFWREFYRDLALGSTTPDQEQRAGCLIAYWDT